MADENKCAHDICVCPKAADSKYCSQHCEDAVDQDITEIRCDCGHKSCE